MQCALKQPPIKSYFNKCLRKGGKESPRFSGGRRRFLSHSTILVVWRGEVWEGARGPMTGPLCGPGWGRVGLSLLGKLFQLQAIRAKFWCPLF